MSGFDYKRFDDIYYSDDDEQGVSSSSSGALAIPPPAVPAQQAVDGGVGFLPKLPEPAKMTTKSKEGRLQFIHKGQLVYEWEQSLEEVNVYINTPFGVTRQMLEVVIEHRHLRIGLKENPPFIDEDTGGPVKVKESMWMLDDGILNVNMQKMLKAEQWDCALVGRAGAEVDAFTKEEIKKKLMLERFQEENPTFDFSGADFNGTVPSAREFMGGVSYN